MKKIIIAGLILASIGLTNTASAQDSTRRKMSQSQSGTTKKSGTPKKKWSKSKNYENQSAGYGKNWKDTMPMRKDSMQ